MYLLETAFLTRENKIDIKLSRATFQCFDPSDCSIVWRKLRTHYKWLQHFWDTVYWLSVDRPPACSLRALEELVYLPRSSTSSYHSSTSAIRFNSSASVDANSFIPQLIAKRKFPNHRPIHFNRILLRLIIMMMSWCSGRSRSLAIECQHSHPLSVCGDAASTDRHKSSAT